METHRNLSGYLVSDLRFKPRICSIQSSANHLALIFINHKDTFFLSCVIKVTVQNFEVTYDRFNMEGK